MENQRKISDPLAYRWVILFITTGVQVTIAFISQGIGTLAPFLVDGFGLTKAQVGLATGAVNNGMILTLFLAGRLADARGEKLVLVGGALFSGISIIMATFARTFSLFLCLLIFTGLWAAGSTPAGSKAVSVWFPFSQRGMILGIRQTGVPIGGFLAALVLPPIALAFGWHGALYVMGILALLGAGICFVAYRERAADVTAASGIQKPSVVNQVLRNPNIWFVAVTACTMLTAQFAILSYLILFLNEKIGLSISIGSLYLALAQLAGVGGRIFWGRISDTVFKGARKPALICVCLLAAVMPVVMNFISSKTSLWELGVVVFLFGFSAVSWNGLFITLCSEMTGREMAGAAVGFGLTVAQLSVFIFPPIFGLVVDLSGSYEKSWLGLSAFILVGLLSLAMVKETPKLNKELAKTDFRPS